MEQTVVKVDRLAVRAWVLRQRPALEVAQAEGRLARIKLDLKDAVADAFPDLPDGQHHRLIEVFGEEIEALCQDLRLATVTVQQQVERTAPARRDGASSSVFLSALMVSIAVGAMMAIALGVAGSPSPYPLWAGGLIAFVLLVVQGITRKT